MGAALAGYFTHAPMRESMQQIGDSAACHGIFSGQSD
jgi:hypothetical protein